ncbi:prohibitin family protein [Bradyrhizobium sp. HKCCYLS2038]|uniref:prohibitin family protein n=1 Tax=unclassified Bradyrhizobium TaxID=2631580 RepID=UPI003EB7ED26
MKTRTTVSSASPPTRWQRFASRWLPLIVVSLMVATVFLSVMYPFVAVTVPSGQAGVLWKRIGHFSLYCFCMAGRGTVLDPHELRNEGLHFVWPWDRLFLYDLRLQSATQTYNAISKDGVSIAATINVRFQLKHNSLPQLHKFIGPEYMDLVVRPELGSRAREVIAQYSAEEVYSTAREAIKTTIRSSGQAKVDAQLNRLVQPETVHRSQLPDNVPLAPALNDAIDIVDVLVLEIVLPEAVMSAINRKIEQYYVAQEYEYRVIRETRESERKRIEATGIRDFQQIVSQGISDSYLRWRGIEATLQLAQSHNAKTVIIGSNKDGLPIILGNADAPAPAPAVANAEPAAPPPAPRPRTETAAPAGSTSDAAPVALPPAEAAKPAPVTPEPGPQDSGTPPKSQSLFPPSWSDIPSLVSPAPPPPASRPAPRPYRPRTERPPQQPQPPR